MEEKKNAVRELNTEEMDKVSGGKDGDSWVMEEIFIPPRVAEPALGKVFTEDPGVTDRKGR